MRGTEFLNLQIKLADRLNGGLQLGGQSGDHQHGRVDDGAVGSQRHTLFDRSQSLLERVGAD